MHIVNWPPIVLVESGAVLRWIFPLIAGSHFQELLQGVGLDNGPWNVLQVGNPRSRNRGWQLVS